MKIYADTKEQVTVMQTHLKDLVEVFVFNTNLTFLQFLYIEALDQH